MGADDLKQIETAVQQGIANALLNMGLNTKDPLEMQKDLAFLRQQRQVSEKVSSIVRGTLITCAITGLLGVLWVGVKTAMNH